MKGPCDPVVHDLKRETERSWRKREKENRAEKAEVREEGKEKEETNFKDALGCDNLILIFIYTVQMYFQKYPPFFVLS